MDRTKLEAMAVSLGIERVAGMDQVALIHSIQVTEGNCACFLSEISHLCGIEDCLWREAGCGGAAPTSRS
jgi:hypothetical protein